MRKENGPKVTTKSYKENTENLGVILAQLGKLGFQYACIYKLCLFCQDLSRDCSEVVQTIRK